ncbi:MAG: Gfo/Idh/MocA family oxidoreductase [Verrucomicrobia bacterium]|nr:Gfo/Idh/MocA family oxidoreductase [Verrucomicrobiota bacterium]
MNPINRRTFVKQSVATAATVSVLGSPRAYAANETIGVAFMGLGGRGGGLLEMFARRPDVRVAGLADPDTRRLERARGVAEKIQGRAPKAVQDFRRLLEDKAVEVLVNATPDHWHALGSVWACQAGKDVYVEKPMAHSIWEGRKLIEAVKKHGRVLQVGMQSRSAPYMEEAVAYVKSGRLGDIRLVRVYNMMQHPMQHAGPDREPPVGFDYDLWCGPAARLPYNPSRSWLNLAEFSCGPIPGDAVHQLDLARLLMGDPSCPRSVSATGGIHVLRDGRDTPDTQLASFEYDTFTLLFQASLWTPYMKKIPVNIRNSDAFPDWGFCSTKIELLGTRACMVVGRHGGGWQVYDANNACVASTPGRPGDAEHIDNFLECVRTRAQPKANAEQGHASVLLCHLANIAWRTGNQKLAFDPQTESFPGEPAANALLKRARYREPYVLPEAV